MAFIEEADKVSFKKQKDNFTVKNNPLKVEDEMDKKFSEKNIAIKDDNGYPITTSNEKKENISIAAAALSVKRKSEISKGKGETFSEKSQSEEKDIFSDATEKSGKALFKNEKKSEKHGFKDKKRAFLSKTDLAFGLAKKEDNEAEISDIDDKAITILTYQSRKHLDQATYLKADLKRTKNADEKTKSNRSSLKNEEGASKDVDVHSAFRKSDYDFTDKKKQFTSPFADRFRLLGKDALGNDLFLPNCQEKSSATALMLQMKSGEKDVSPDMKTATEGKTDEKFGITTLKENENKNRKSVDSRFNKETETKNPSSAEQKFTSNEDKYNKANEQRKTKKKEYSQETKKAARIAAVSNMLRAKKVTQNQLGNMSGEVTGDLLKDGAGFLQVIMESLKEAMKTKVKAAVISAAASFFGFLASIISAIAPFIVIIITVVIVITSFFSIFTDGVDVPDGDGYTYASLSDDEIGEIIEELYLSYPDMSYEQELLLEYALSKVGCAYDQNYHWSLTEDIFDCSSLAYRSYLEVGINISNAGIYSASEECRMVVDGMHLVTGELMPGDLIFYGGSDNDRYMGVYHVAIYVGDGKMVEARGTSWGVVYCDVRTTNAVAYGRYL